MSREEFIKLTKNKTKDMSEEEIDKYYDFSISLFNLLFDKWKTQVLCQKNVRI